MQRLTVPRDLLVTLTVMLVFGCGSRTELSAISQKPAPLETTDPCAAAVLEGAPKPIRGSCSTRDGRARGIAAPKSPHVVWQTAIPYVDDFTSIDRQTTLVTDNAHHAYVGSFITIGSTAPQFRRVDTRTGAIEWAAPAAESKNGLALLLLQNAKVDLTTGGSPVNLLSFASASPTPTQTSQLPFDANQLIDPAVGADGSLYFFYMTPGETTSTARVSRVLSDGTLAWTSLDLTSFGVVPQAPILDNVIPVGISLGPGDAIYAAMTVNSADGHHSVLNALDPAGGSSRWSSAAPGEASLPVVASDGSVAIVNTRTETPPPTFEVFDPAGHALPPATIDGAEAVIGVTTDGTFLLQGENSSGSGDVMAVDSAGSIFWSRDVDVDDGAIIATNGIAIVKGEFGISAIDLKTGAIVWQLAPPSAGQCISSGTLALTSDGAVMALQCDGTLFAAAD